MLLQIYQKHLGTSLSAFNMVTSNQGAILSLHQTNEVDNDQTSKQGVVKLVFME
jgi:hypothetical protein